MTPKTNHRTRFRTLALLAALALAIAACGGDSVVGSADDPDDATTTATAAGAGDTAPAADVATTIPAATVPVDPDAGATITTVDSALGTIVANRDRPHPLRLRQRHLRGAELRRPVRRQLAAGARRRIAHRRRQHRRYPAGHHRPGRRRHSGHLLRPSALPLRSRRRPGRRARPGRRRHVARDRPGRHAHPRRGPGWHVHALGGDHRSGRRADRRTQRAHALPVPR